MVCTKKPPHFIASAHSIRPSVDGLYRDDTVHGTYCVQKAATFHANTHSIARSTPEEALQCYLHFAPRVLHFSAIHSGGLHFLFPTYVL